LICERCDFHYYTLTPGLTGALTPVVHLDPATATNPDCSSWFIVNLRNARRPIAAPGDLHGHDSTRRGTGHKVGKPVKVAGYEAVGYALLDNPNRPAFRFQLLPAGKVCRERFCTFLFQFRFIHKKLPAECRKLILFHVALMVGGVGLAILDVFGRHWDFTFTFAVRTHLHFFIAKMMVNFDSIAAQRQIPV
jgi:hypothetical protein